MNSNPILSICIPTYNRRSHIKRQLDFFVKEMNSINDANVEIIISNNASEDGTHELLEEYDDKYSWLQINNNSTNLGARGNMCLLQSIATGTYIWIPGDDDYLKKGLLNKILNVIAVSHPGYIHISRRCLIEETKSIIKEGKIHNVKYDTPLELVHSDIFDLIYNNFDDLKFQTASIFRREDSIKFEKELLTFPEDVQADCHSLFKSIRAMQRGSSYFISDICILSGNVISWGNNALHYLTKCDPYFILGLERFHFSSNECKKLYKRQLATSLIAIVLNDNLRRRWWEDGLPGLSIELLPDVCYLALRKILRLMGIRKYHKVALVDIKEFLPDN